jgi:hypothetical protein
MGQETTMLIMILFIFFIMTLLVFTNTYNIYRLTKVNEERNNLMEMQEFSDIHPMIKELYKETIVNGVLFMQNMLINDVIKMNKIDKWYNANREDLLALITVIKEIGKKQYDSKKKTFKLPAASMKKLFDLDIKKITKVLKEFNDTRDKKDSDYEKLDDKLNKEVYK